MSQTTSDELVMDEGYESVKLGSIFKYEKKSKRKSSFGNEIGKYNFYTSCDNVKKCDEADYNEECLIIEYNIKASIEIDSCFSCSENNYVIKTPNAKYIYYLFKGNMKILNDGYKGTFIKQLSKEYLSNITLRIPKSQEKIDEWVNKASSQYNAITHKLCEIKELETLEQNIFCEIENNEDCNIVELGNVCSIKYENEIENNEVQSIIFGSGMTNNYISEYSSCNKNIKIKNCGMTSNSCFKALSIIYYFKNNNFTLKSCDECMTDEYLWHYLYNNKDKILNIRKGICFGINIDMFKHIKISIPKNIDLINELEKCFTKLKSLYEDVNNAQELYNQILVQLCEDYIKKI